MSHESETRETFVGLEKHYHSPQRFTFRSQQLIEKLSNFLLGFILFLLYVLEFCVTTVGNLSFVGQEKQQLQGMRYGQQRVSCTDLDYLEMSRCS